MRILLTLLLLLSFMPSFGQVTKTYEGGPKQVIINRGGQELIKALRIPERDTTVPAIDGYTDSGQVAIERTSRKLIYHDGSKWVVAGSGSGAQYVPGYGIVIADDTIKVDTSVVSGGDVSFDGNRAITLAVSGFSGVTPTGSTVQEFLNNLFYPTTPPTSALTISIPSLSISNSTAPSIEKRPVGSIAITLNWTGGRQAQTAPLSSIVVGGVSQSFSQPAAPGTVSGTQSSTVTANTNQSYNITVSTNETPAKTSSLSRTISFFDKRYWGFVNTTTPTDADILALTSDNSGSTRTKSATSVSNASPLRLCWVQPEYADPSYVSEIWIGGLNSTAAFTRTTRAFTNASGFTQNYNIWVQNTTTSAGVNFEIK